MSAAWLRDSTLLSYAQDTTIDDDANDLRPADLRKAPTIGPEKILAERMESGVLKYRVKWAGYDSKHNTWETMTHLAGCESMIADFKQRGAARVSGEEHSNITVAQALKAPRSRSSGLSLTRTVLVHDRNSSRR